MCRLRLTFAIVWPAFHEWAASFAPVAAEMKPGRDLRGLHIDIKREMSNECKYRLPSNLRHLRFSSFYLLIWLDVTC